MPRRRRNTSIAYPRDSGNEEQIAAVAEASERRHNLSRKAARWLPLTYTTADERGEGTVLALDDYSQIPFLRDVIGVEWYPYRARLRCGDDDWYAVACPEIPGYEEYNREYLGLGRASLLRVQPSSASALALAQRLRTDQASFSRLCGLAQEVGRLILHPYMGIEPVWELAEAIHAGTGIPVRVLAPYPEVTRLANDKGRFSEIVETLLGKDALTRTTVADEPESLAKQLRAEIQRSDSVALKMPSCASGMGNRIYDARQLRGRPLRTFRALVDRFLDEKEWNGREAVLVVEWHRDVLESPSAQCWIPADGAGEPQVEEIFQQFLLGEEQVFEGAMLSGLPQHLRRQFTVGCWLISRVFQRLGYVGRCSFDGLVVGKTLADARMKIVECNGRWGGTSTPMHLMKRVFGDFRHLPYKAQDYMDDRLRGLEFQALLEIFGGDLYDSRTGKGRVLLYNVGGITEYGKFDLAVTGRTFAEVNRYLTERIPSLIARYLSHQPRRRAIL